MRGAAVERDQLDGAMRREQDRAARRLVDAARLHADEAVLDQVEPADAICPTQFIEPRQDRRRRQCLAVDAHRVALGKADAHFRGLIGRVHRRERAHIDARRRRLRRVLQHLALGGGVQEVGVDRERRLAFLVLGDRNLVGARELEQVVAPLERPLPPRRHDLDRRVERVIGELEAHLVVAFSRRAVTHRVGANFRGDLDLLLGDQRPRDRGAEQVLPLVQRVGAEHREHVVADELLAQVLDEDVAGLDAEQQRLLARRARAPRPGRGRR